MQVVSCGYHASHLEDDLVCEELFEVKAGHLIDLASRNIYSYTSWSFQKRENFINQNFYLQ